MAYINTQLQIFKFYLFHPIQTTTLNTIESPKISPVQYLLLQRFNLFNLNYINKY